MITASNLTKDLGGNWHGGYGTAPCPVCQPDQRRAQNALTLTEGTDGRLLLHCKKSGCAFRDILATSGVSGSVYAPPDPAIAACYKANRKGRYEKRAAQARAIWDEARPIAGTLAETYLHNRGITCDLPDTLRFHSRCWHGGTGSPHPAMVARVEGASGFAIHRTWLARDGAKAQITQAKMMLGSCSGGAVRLCEGAGPLVVAEGLETALSLLCGILAGPPTVWASLSTSGMKAMKLPATPGRMVIATDGDAPGRAAGQELAQRAFALGWHVSLIPAPDGQDWNDVLREGVVT